MWGCMWPFFSFASQTGLKKLQDPLAGTSDTAKMPWRSFKPDTNTGIWTGVASFEPANTWNVDECRAWRQRGVWIGVWHRANRPILAVVPDFMGPQGPYGGARGLFQSAASENEKKANDFQKVVKKKIGKSIYFFWALAEVKILKKGTLTIMHGYHVLIAQRN